MPWAAAPSSVRLPPQTLRLTIGPFYSASPGALRICREKAIDLTLWARLPGMG
jgi:hypothetical protein